MEIGIGGVDLDVKVIVERHAPEAVILGLSSNAEFLPKSVVGLQIELKRCAASVEMERTEKTPEKISPRAITMAL